MQGANSIELLREYPCYIIYSKVGDGSPPADRAAKEAKLTDQSEASRSRAMAGNTLSPGLSPIHSNNPLAPTSDRLFVPQLKIGFTCPVCK